MPRKRRPSDVAAKTRRQSGQHRTLLYVEGGDGRGYPEKWGWWCRDCSETREPTTKPAAVRSSDRHRARTRTLQEA